MMTDLDAARKTLLTGEYTCVLCHNDLLRTSTRRGVAPLLAWLEAGDVPPGFSAADKVVGRATAFLYCLLGAKAVYAAVISRGALQVLEENGIAVTYDQQVDSIRNRQNDGVCPMEAATQSVTRPQDAPAAIYAALEALKH